MAIFSYRRTGSFMSGVSAMADHAIIDAARFQNRQKRRPAEMLRLRSESNPGGPEPVDTKTPSRLFAQEEQLKKLLERLTALPAQYRQVIRRFFICSAISNVERPSNLAKRISWRY